MFDRTTLQLRTLHHVTPCRHDWINISGVTNSGWLPEWFPLENAQLHLHQAAADQVMESPRPVCIELLLLSGVIRAIFCAAVTC